MADTKICANCREEKPVSEFYKRGDRKDTGKTYYRSRCKACCEVERTENAERYRLKTAAWRAVDPERARASCRASRQKYIDVRREYAREKWRNDPEYRERAKAYRDLNPEIYRESYRRWSAENRDRLRDYLREYARANPEKYAKYNNTRRALKRGNGGTYVEEDIVEIRRLQRDKCAYCRIRLNGKGEVDHKVPLSKGGTNDRSNLQLTCKPCNRKKRNRDPIEFARSLGRLL